jgi:glycosyltransferase involved in cell wall biosynthesis
MNVIKIICSFHTFDTYQHTYQLLIISVIIPTYNEYSNIVRLGAFFSNVIYDQTTEIIIADSPLSDDSLSKLNGSFQYIRTNNTGRAAQMNEGAKVAKGNILVFLHADVTPPESFQKDIISALEQGYDFGFFAYDFDPSSFWLSVNASFTGKNGVFAGGGDQIHFMKRSVFEQLNGYDNKMSVMEDFEFFNRVKAHKIPYTIVQNRAQVSSRKYFKNSWLKVNFANLCAFTMSPNFCAIKFSLLQ